MENFLFSSCLVFYAIFLGRTTLIEAAPTTLPQMDTTIAPSAEYDYDSTTTTDYDMTDYDTTATDYDMSRTSTTTAATVQYYNDPWATTNNETTTEQPDGGTSNRTPTARSSRRTNFSSGTRTRSSNSKSSTAKPRKITIYGVGGKKIAWETDVKRTSLDTDTISAIEWMLSNSTKNLTSPEVKEVTLRVLTNGTTVYAFPNGTSFNSSSTSINFPNATVILSFPNGTNVNVTTMTSLNGTTSFAFPNGTSLNSSEIFSLANGTKIIYFDEAASVKPSEPVDERREDQRDMATTSNRFLIPRMARKTTTTSTMAPSSNGNMNGGRRPIRRKGSIPRPAPRPQNDVDTSI